jgi:hypothetical protein
MNLLIPAHRIFQPFALRKTKRRFNLRTYVGFADSFVQVGHEHDGRDLLDESAVLRFHIQQRRFGIELCFRCFGEIEGCTGGQRLLLQKNVGEFLQGFLRFRQTSKKSFRAKRFGIAA